MSQNIRTSLYVGDLHHDVNESMLFEIFSKAGTVLSIRVCRDVSSMKSLGYGYVNFQHPADAEKVLDDMNFDLINGKQCRIMWSQRDPAVRKSGVGNIFIKNLDKSIDAKALCDTFSAFGNILSCKISTDANGSKGYGFVHFDTEESAKASIEMVNGMLLNGKQVFVGQFLAKNQRINSLKDKSKIFTNVYVKNFCDQLDDSKLKELFGKFGNILSSKVICDENLKSKGFGFVSYSDHESAQNAVDELNGKDIGEDHILYVARAQKKVERGAELKEALEKIKTKKIAESHGSNLYVKNLKEDIDNEMLKNDFGVFGTITSAMVMTENGKSKGFGFVNYSSPEEATKAINEMHGKIVRGKPIYVALAQRKDERKAVFMAHRNTSQNGPLGPILLNNQNNLMLPAKDIQCLGQRVRYIGGVQPMMHTRPMGSYVPIRQAPQNTMSARPVTVQQVKQKRMTQASPSTQVVEVKSKSQVQTPQVAVVTSHESLLTSSVFADALPQEQKQMLGDRMYPLIQGMYPDLAGKVTGMLLEIDNSELFHMLESMDSLRAKVEEAVAVLHAHQAKKHEA